MRKNAQLTMNCAQRDHLLGVAVLFLLFAAALSPWALAKEADPDSSTSVANASGYNRNSIYTTIDGPEIDAFNFNFVVEFPVAVGLSYPENAGLNLQLNLTYNSRVWHWQKQVCNRKFFRVRRQNPFGLGFDLTLGRIIRSLTANPDSGWQYMYVDSSGATHRLALFSGDEYRSHDGSHIRAVLASDAWTVGFPNGVVHELDHHITGPTISDMANQGDPCDPQDFDDPPTHVFMPDGPPPVVGWDRVYVGWHVTKVYTRASLDGAAIPSYTVSYYGDDGNVDDAPFAHIIKEINDRFGRRIWTDLDRTDGTVTAIHAPAPADECGSPRTADYLLNYGTTSLAISGLPGPDPGQTHTETHVATVLQSISGPNVAPPTGATNCALGSTQRYVHTFEYQQTVPGNFGGQLNAITYPSGKKVVMSFAYSSYANGGPGYCMPSGDVNCVNDATGGGSWNPSLGVNRIDTYLDGNMQNTALGNLLSTSFSQAQVRRDWNNVYGGTCSSSPEPGHPAGYERWDQVHTMVDPAGNKTEFVYRTPKERGEEPWYGLLVSQKYYGGIDPNARLLKQIDYDHALLDSYSFNIQTNDFEIVPRQIKTTWVDDTTKSGSALPFPTVLTADRSNFDRFGHYQRSEFSGTAIGDERKIVIKDYASDNMQGGGSLCTNASTLQSNWLGDVVAREEVRKSISGAETVISRADYGYDCVRGLRTNAVSRSDASVAIDACTNAPSASNGDSVTEYGFTPLGDLATERHYVPGLIGTNAPTDVTTSYTYSYGARESTKQNALPYFDSFRIIDPSSGLVTTERAHVTSPTDTSGESTTFAYDVLGRVIKFRNGTDDAIVIAYENDAVTPSPAVRLARVRSTQGTSIAQTEAVDHFVHGRLDHEEKLNPDGSRAYRYTAYNNFDRVSFVTEWTRQSSGAGVPGTATDYAVRAANGTYLFEEPFARPSTITDALGGVTAFRYFGRNNEVTTQGVALKASLLDDPASVRSWYYTDGLGRLRVVSAPAVISQAGHGPYEQTGAGGKYTFDVLGRMTQAEISGSVSLQPGPTDRYNATATSAQTRTFTFDTLGHLTQTTTPEAGTVTNLAWNALGQVTETQDALGLAWGHKHRTTYDGAGRPIRVERLVTSGATPNNAYNAGDGTWDTHANAWRFDSPGTCLQQPAGVNQPSWYVGTASCQYATGAPTGALDLDSPAIAVPHGAILTFAYFREVRDEVGLAGNHDRFSVKVEDQAVPGTWTEVYFLDSSQVSWPKWVQSPPISLEAWAGKSVKIRFEFNSVTQNLSTTLRGIGISQVSVRRLTLVTLQETAYDETFSLVCNKPRGKPTTIKDYDEATGTAIFTRELHYCDPNSRLSDEVLTFDWDRDGVNQALEDAYRYDSRGDISQQWKPHLVGVPTRRYEYFRARGALIGISATDEGTGVVQNLIPGSTGDSILYNDAGGMSRVRLGNGLQQHLETNADFLPSRIWVDGIDIPTIAWDTGQYLYDGARNIKQIGQDYYRYDAAMRLTWARVNTSRQGVVDLDPAYDVFGNMTAQSGIQGGSFTDALPQGLVFSGRTFASNRIANSGFNYDSNGNLKEEPAHDGLSAQRYFFTPENQLARITPGSAEVLPSAPSQTALYEGGDHRWFRSVWADGGKALITLRDASGQVVADYMEANAASGLTLQREYVHANGQLVAINSTCGPRPALTLSGQTSSPVLVWFDKTDYVPAAGSYTIYIRADSGQMKTITKPSSLANHFSLAQTEFFPGTVNWIQIETDASCGHTGYSNAVSYAYALPGGGTGSSCLTSMGVSRLGFNGSGSNIRVLAVGDNCLTGTTYNVYYVDPEAEATELTPLNGSTPTSNPSQLLANIPCGSGEGTYWIRPVSPVTHLQQPSSPVVLMDGTSCGGSGESGTANAFAAPGQPGMNAQYVHWDHLGSTRVMTDERGVSLAAFKFYPFGMEAESSGGDELRQKFTGHERDDGVGLDYMLARYYEAGVGRFVSADPAQKTVRNLGSPQRWNRYTYALNNPIKFFDPDGMDIALAKTGDSRSMMNFLVQMAMRPGGRAALDGLASNHSFTTTYQDKAINSPAVVQQIAKTGAKAELKLGTTTATDPQGNPSSTQALVSVDTNAVMKVGHDKSGLTTTGHETYHATDMQNQKSDAEVKEGDDSGAAEAFGAEISNEKPDMEKKDAKKLVKSWLNSK